MKTTRVKLATLAAVAVVVTMLAASVAFNLFVGWKVEADATGDIEYALGLNDSAVDTGRSPNYLALDSAYGIDRSESMWSTPEEAQLAAWFSQHPETGVVSRVTLDGWTCYAAIEPKSYFFEYPEDPYVGEYYYTDSPWEQYEPSYAPRRSGYYVAYIDTASEQSLIAAVNTAFAIIGILGAFAAAASGFVAGRRIDDAHDSQKRFYENMSHDLKTPLAAIRGYAEGAGNGLVDTRDAVNAIIRETDRMSETINEILNLSRLESGMVQVKKEPVCVADFVQDCLMPLEGAVRNKGLDVQLQLADGEIQADPNLFDHALSNVLTNAVRHASSCIRIRFDGTSLSVWSDGTAPAPEMLPHLFDRFHSGEGGSTGIGLAIAKEMAALHGWEVSARAVDNGLELRFTF